MTNAERPKRDFAEALEAQRRIVEAEFNLNSGDLRVIGRDGLVRAWSAAATSPEGPVVVEAIDTTAPRSSDGRTPVRSEIL